MALLWLRDETDARRAERMRADFLANASHELRTPLASLAGYIETLRGHARDDPAARDHFLSIMHVQADRMARLIDDLLSLSRIELNEHVPPAGEVDLAAAAADVISALAPQIEERQVKIDFAPPRAGVTVEGDRDQIVQVIQNLVDNAVKYTPSGGTVHVELTPGQTLDSMTAPRLDGAGRQSLLMPDRDGASRYVAIRVTDEGPGIARQHLPRLSERFYRVEGQKGGGTGLGLAIVKHVVNRHRGGLTVESAEGGGTTFSVYLPVAPPA
jgi:two-component system phosphate regulon sensor histidine kinase PhoR